MSNPWAIKLKKTGFIEKHLESEKSSINELEEKQMELRSAALVNTSKVKEYKEWLKAELQKMANASDNDEIEIN